MLASNSPTPTIVTHGTTVLERVLLAIINAHATPETVSRQYQRLDAAMTALLGPVTEMERKLEQALSFIVRERQRDTSKAEIAAISSRAGASAGPVRSIMQLAETAAREIMSCTTPADVRAMARLLCERYRIRCHAQRVEYDPVTDALEAEAVERICTELHEWGVPTRF